jgi:hypothetical protein
LLRRAFGSAAFSYGRARLGRYAASAVGRQDAGDGELIRRAVANAASCAGDTKKGLS